MLYTIGGLENLQAAKKYYASAINLTGGKNRRALFGVCLVSSCVLLENSIVEKPNTSSYVHKLGLLCSWFNLFSKILL